MPHRQSARQDLSLKWLELFQICAQKGSLRAASEESGLTISTISHHLRKLEDHLGGRSLQSCPPAHGADAKGKGLLAKH